MNILFASSEAVPYCKTGGLADVAGALPNALASGGRASLVLFVPYYRSVRESGFALKKLGTLKVPLGGRTVEARLLSSREGGVPAWLLDCPEFFDRAGIYGERGRDYPDNAERYAFFSRAAFEACRLEGLRPEILHANDWQTGLVPAFLETHYGDDELFAGTGTVFTVHNMAYQGKFPKEILPKIGMPYSELHPDRLEFRGNVSWLKAGLAYADVINTVSPSYAKEIGTPEFGRGLEGVIRRRADALHGVLNGLDLSIWNPSEDGHLPRRYGAENWQKGKAVCKEALQREAGLETDPKALLIGLVSRMDSQKGLDLAVSALPAVLKGGAQFVALGSGDSKLEKRFSDFAKANSGRAYYRNDFDERFAHRIYAGCDLFLMPSRFEPCGLGQMIAMRYGALPVATATGGLADTVTPEGFLAGRREAGAVSSALKEAASLFGKPAWNKRVSAAMKRDFSWERSAQRYLELYAKARGAARPQGGR